MRKSNAAGTRESRAHAAVTKRSSTRSSSAFFTSTFAGDHAGLLQGEAGLQNGVALRRTDAAVGQIGPFLELNIDHGARQLGHLHEDALLVIVIAEAIFARLLIDREHAPGQIGIFLRKSSLELRMP